MGRSQREKGKRWERKVAADLREIFPDSRRGWQCRSGEDAPDVGAGPYWVECKAGAKPNPRAALEQAEGDCPQGRIPVAVVKDDRRRPFVVISWADFLDLIRELEERS